jgi:hypothetical protein
VDIKTKLSELRDFFWLPEFQMPIIDKWPPPEWERAKAAFMEEILLREEAELVEYLANANLSALIRLNNSIIKAIEKKRLDLGAVGASK